MLEGFRLDRQVALITGATGGLGGAMARTFAAAGARVAVADLPARQDEAEGLARELAATHGTGAVAVALDVTDVEGIERAVDRVESELGPLDVLVANAGIAIRKPALELTEDDWDRVLDVD